MSGEQRVTDERLAGWCEAAERNINEIAGRHFDALALDLRDERTAHCATEAKLRAASAEVERLKDAWRAAESDNAALHERALSAESALAATKAHVKRLDEVINAVHVQMHHLSVEKDIAGNPMEVEHDPVGSIEAVIIDLECRGFKGDAVVNTLNDALRRLLSIEDVLGVERAAALATKEAPDGR